ncbi:fasciclin domain-containing protein [Chitinophaga lutea]
MKKISHHMKLFLALALLASLFAACRKDYYNDTGLAKGRYNGSIMDYLESKPFYFDTLTQVVKLAGMEDVLRKEMVTFFAPSNACFDSTLKSVNKLLYADGKDTISELNQVPKAMWRKLLSRYVFRGKNMLNDYPQLDPAYFATYPGQFYKSYDNELMNIGVIYGNEGGAQYAGYRQLTLSYTPDVTFKPNNWMISFVASVNVEPNNGAVHVLRFARMEQKIGDITFITSGHFFGFSYLDFYQLCKEYGVGE